LRRCDSESVLRGDDDNGDIDGDSFPVPSGAEMEIAVVACLLLCLSEGTELCDLRICAITASKLVFWTNVMHLLQFLQLFWGYIGLQQFLLMMETIFATLSHPVDRDAMFRIDDQKLPSAVGAFKSARGGLNSVTSPLSPAGFSSTIRPCYNGVSQMFCVKAEILPIYRSVIPIMVCPVTNIRRLYGDGYVYRSNQSILRLFRRRWTLPGLLANRP
jgi:hypothetical protein